MSSSHSFVREVSGGIVLRLHVQPGAKRNEIVGPHGDSLKVKIKVPPEDGKANAELIRFIAEIFKVRRSEVRIEAGLTSRGKQVFIQGVNSTDPALEKLGRGFQESSRRNETKAFRSVKRA